jgi:hypothetical protein
MTAHEQTMLALVIGLLTLAALAGLAVGCRLANPRNRAHRTRGYLGWWRQ